MQVLTVGVDAVSRADAHACWRVGLGETSVHSDAETDGRMHGRMKMMRQNLLLDPSNVLLTPRRRTLEGHDGQLRGAC